jgi:hypothetical protein
LGFVDGLVISGAKNGFSFLLKEKGYVLQVSLFSVIVASDLFCIILYFFAAS